MPDLVAAIRNVSWLLAVKICWLSANLILWLLGLGSSFEDPHCWMALNIFLPLIFVLALPGSVLFLVLNEFFNAADYAVTVSPVLHYTFLAFGSLIFGYIQWFVLARVLFSRRSGFISIFMDQRQAAVSPLRPLFEINPRNEFVLFDVEGRTPLERILADDE